MNHAARQRGFTLIELMLAMAFVSTLLLAIAMIIVQIGSIYNKGITYTDVNKAGSSIVSELQKSIDESTPDISGTDSLYVQRTWGGRLCTNNYSYIWNYGKALAGNQTRNEYNDPDTGTEIHFVKVLDSTNEYCKDDITLPMSKIDKTNAIELLDAGQHTLVIHSFKIISPDSAIDTVTRQRLYSITFTIGTNDQNTLTINPDTDEVSCKLPDDRDSNPLYCTVNQFNVTARAGNEAKQ